METIRERLINAVRMKMSTRTMLEQLAEEAAELSQAALKLIRTMNDENPTPVTREEAEANLVEEASDVMLVLETLCVSIDRELQLKKIIRWWQRLETEGD